MRKRTRPNPSPGEVIQIKTRKQHRKLFPNSSGKDISLFRIRFKDLFFIQNKILGFVLHSEQDLRIAQKGVLSLSVLYVLTTV